MKNEDIVSKFVCEECDNIVKIVCKGPDAMMLMRSLCFELPEEEQGKWEFVGGVVHDQGHKTERVVFARRL